MRTAPAALLLFALLAAPTAPRREANPARALRILVTNDDGIDSQGLTTLVRELAALGEVVVSAPDGNRSGASHATTMLHEPMTVTRASVEGAAQAVAVSGTPADAAAYGILALGGERGFDFVVSGVNRGANVGMVAHHSGTVGAAMEGAARGIPSVAVSLDAFAQDFEPAARFTARFLRAWTEHAPKSDVVWSINVPRGALERMQGVVAAPMAGSYVRALGFERVSGDDASQVVRGQVKFVRESPAGSDTAAWLAGSITLTPLRCDWTDERALADVATWGLTLAK